MCLSSFGLNGVIFGCVRDNTGFDSCSNSKFNSVEQGITLVSFWLFYESAEYDWLKWAIIRSWEDKSIGLFKRLHFFSHHLSCLPRSWNVISINDFSFSAFPGLNLLISKRVINFIFGHCSFQSFVNSLFDILSNDLIWGLEQGGCGSKERKEDLCSNLKLWWFINISATVRPLNSTWEV